MASKILVIVEGAKTDLRLMKHLLNIYGIDKKHEGSHQTLDLMASFL